jgi:hypothetical protein
MCYPNDIHGGGPYLPAVPLVSLIQKCVHDQHVGGGEVIRGSGLVILIMRAADGGYPLPSSFGLFYGSVGLLPFQSLTHIELGELAGLSHS